MLSLSPARRPSLFYLFFLLILSVLFLNASANAATTAYSNKATLEAAVGPTRSIDFSLDDAGNPLSDPLAWIEFDFLGLSGICFSEGIGSYSNQYLTQRPATPIKAEDHWSAHPLNG